MLISPRAFTPLRSAHTSNCILSVTKFSVKHFLTILAYPLEVVQISYNTLHKHYGINPVPVLSDRCNPLKA